MQMAKASKEDIQKMIDFFSIWELMEEREWEIDSTDYEDELNEKLAPYDYRKHRDSYGDFEIQSVKDLFFQNWFGEMDFRWRRVVFGCDILIDNVCDPDKNILAFHPKFEPVIAG